MMFVRWLVLRVAVLCLCAACAVPVSAQRALPTPDVDLAAGGFVYALARQPDGGTVFSGAFATFGGLPRTGLARLRPDGTPDPDWDVPSLDFTTALVADADGNVYATDAHAGVVKVTPSGTIDTAFQINQQGAVERLALDGAGHLYVAGASLTQVGETTVAGIARVDAATGEVDHGWVLSAAVEGSIYALAADANALYVGGEFDVIDGQKRRHLAKLTASGSVDPTWAPNPDGTVHALAASADGLYVGGNYTTIGTQAISGFARVALDGAGNADAAWIPTVLSFVNGIALDGAGRVYAVGSLSTADNVSRTTARFSAATAAVDSNWTPTPNRSPTAIVADAAGAIIGGDFDRVSQLPRFGLAAYDADSALLPAANLERVAHVWAVARHPDGGIVIGGDFDRAGALVRRHLARITATGDVDANWNPSPNEQVLALATDATGAVYAGGLFNAVDEQPRNYLAKILNDGTLDPVWNPWPDFIVRAIASADDGTLFIGGAFSSVGWVSQSRIAHLRPNGTVDPTWNPGPNGEVYALALDGNGALFAGGAFTESGGRQRRNLVKLHPHADAAGAVDAAWNVPVDGPVEALQIDANGALYIGGSFSTVAGLARESLARIGANGTVDDWHAIPGDGQPPASGHVRTLALDATGHVYAGGGLRVAPYDFTWCARFSTDTGAFDAGWQVRSDYEVSTLAAGPDGTLIAAGGFTTIGGAQRRGVAVLTTNDAIFANGFEER